MFQASRVLYRAGCIRGNDRHDGGGHGRSALCACDRDSGNQAESTELVITSDFEALLTFSLEKFFKKLLGRNDVEDALKRMDKLTQDEAKMATAEVLNNVKVLIYSM